MVFSQIPIRSISLPSKLDSNTDCDYKLQKLKSVPVSSEAIQSALLILAELYNSLQELEQSTSTQQSLFVQGKSFQESILEGSVELLDSCNTIKELFQMMREKVQFLQSALRRTGNESNIQSDIATYFRFRKKMNHCISKSLKNLKYLEHKINGTHRSAYADEYLITALRERAKVTIKIFKSILLFISCSKLKSGGCNLVQRLMGTKPETCSRDDQSIMMSEVGSVDFALSRKKIDAQSVQKSLDNLDCCIEGLELGLGRLFREMIQCRVTLLNILTTDL